MEFFTKSRLDTARFMIASRLRGFSVSGRPQLGEDGTRYFEDRLGSCKFYLEYGSGGSTVLAAGLGLPFIPVENDTWFRRSVLRKFGDFRSDQVLLHADTGFTGKWGIPVVKDSSPARLRRWRDYAEMPWAAAARREQFPDLILIDGRFRVLCALVSLRQLGGHAGTEIIVDDYAGRPHYEMIARVTPLVRMVGRTAVIRSGDVDVEALERGIGDSNADYR